MSDIDTIVAAESGRLGSLVSGAKAALDRALRQRDMVWRKGSDDAMASTTTAAQAMGYVRVAAKIVRAVYIADTGGVTAHATDYGTINVAKYTAAGGSVTTVAAFASDTVTTDDVTQWVPKDLTVVDAAAELVALSALSVAITKAGSGVVFRAGIVLATIQDL